MDAMNISQLELHYRNIEGVMAQLQRSSWRAIMPSDVLPCLQMAIPEKHLRQDMDELVGMGRLVKVGRRAARGYRIATNAQRRAFAEKYGLRPRGEISTSDYTELVYEAIESAVAKAYRDLRRGVLPRDIQGRLPYDRAEGSLRRDMLQMYAAGRIVRVGGQGARQGYRPPTLMEKLAYTLNRGMWPHGTEFVASWAN
jgi:hypothetical protein